MEEGGKVFPQSFQSSSVLDVLRFELDYLGVEILTEAYVVDIKKKKDFVVTLKDGRKIHGQRVILAPGGKAAPNTGSDGNGYTLAQKLGHTIEDIFPGLVQLKLEGNFFKQVSGVKIIGVAELYHEHKLLKRDKGDILFTDYGISGPPILQLSRTALELLNQGEKAELKVSIIHHKTVEDLYEYLQYRFSFMPMKTIEIGLIGFINKRLIIPILKEVQIDKNKKIAHLSSREIRRLCNILTDIRFNVIGSRP